MFCKTATESLGVSGKGMHTCNSSRISAEFHSSHHIDKGESRAVNAEWEDGKFEGRENHLCSRLRCSFQDFFPI